jgi:hypothetical protein
MRWLTARRASISVAILLGLQCGHLDEDPNATLADLAGPDATECGSADANLHDSLSAEEVRACTENALQNGLPFWASASPPSADAGTVIGWASDGQTFWRVRYDWVTGCSPRWHDELDKQTCEDIAIHDADCGRLWDDLCLVCV